MAIYNFTKKSIKKDTLDIIRESQYKTQIPLNEESLIKDMINISNSFILESDGQEDNTNFNDITKKFKEYKETKKKEDNLSKANSLLLSLTFILRLFVKKPNLDKSKLNEVKKLSRELKDEISNNYKAGVDDNNAAKLKKALNNLDITEKYIDDKLTIVNSDIEGIKIEKIEFNMNGLPYYTFNEIYNNKNIDVSDLQDIKYSEWFLEYQLISNGFITENYKNIHTKWIQTLEELCLDRKSNYNKILSLGWNPDLEFTTENRINADKRFRSKIESFNNILDMSYINTDDYLLESTVSNEDIYPVYIVVTYTKSAFGKITRKLTNAKYTHSAFSLDNKLNHMYSYNMAGESKGFSIENLDNFKRDKECIMALYCILVDKSQMKKIKFYLDEQLALIKNTTYSYLNLLGVITGKEIHRNNAMICSQFVDSVLKKAGMDITKKDSALVTPQDFRDSKSHFMIKLYEGEIRDYKPSDIDKKIYKIMNKSFIKESVIINEKELPIRFDNDGNLLIDNMKSKDFDNEYYNCHRLLINYEKTDNIEGMKLEIAKLWYINSILESKIYGDKNISKNDKVEYLKIRAKILNDFTKYCKLVSVKEKDFNFSEYYKATPFNDTLVINKSTLKHTTKAVKSLIKAILI